MKTIKEWLMELPEPIKSRALKYGDFSFGNLEPSLRDAILGFKEWDYTEEGSDYWSYVASLRFDEAESLLDTRKQNSREAHESVNKEKVHQVILDTLFTYKDYVDGMSKDEISLYSVLTPEQVHKRMSELEKAGKVKPNGKRKGSSGRNQTIWKLI
jgi:hypothetical protein